MKSEIRHPKSDTRIRPSNLKLECSPANRRQGFRASGLGLRSSVLPAFPAIRDGSILFALFLLLFAPGARAQDHHDPLATFFLGRIKYSQNDGNDCGGVGQDLMRLVSRASTLKVQQEKKVRLTDPELFETPFVFMNGHNDFVLTEAELEVLRKYLSHGGFFFASGCCTNPNFPKAWRREFSRLFANEPVKGLPYDHLIYRSFYNISRIRSLHENREIQLEGLFHQGNLVAVLCEEGLCCSFSMNNKCNDGKGVGPYHGQKLALTIAASALTH